MRSRVINEEAVLVFAVLSKRLAVIAQRDDQRRIIQMILLEPRDQISEFVIGIGNLAIVEMVA